ncbi:MAG: hypothetical protein J6V25_02730 [Oscillospiraceae bacterium]|nr:hypothetical protein [Oscillospiraceae bacterium]
MATTYTQRQYAESDAVKKLREQLEAQTTAKPADYTSKWQNQVDAAAQNILNRKEFSYDVNGDAMWNQYKDRYTTLGRQAMQDTMGQAAALTGGYGNSNSQIAGQQVYQGYMQGLTDKIPELEQLALDRYNQQGQQLYDQYNLLNTQEQNAYNQWLQNYNLWNDERNYLTGRFDTERGYDYGVHRDTVSDDQWKAQFDEDIRRFDYANKLGEFAKKKSSSGGSGDGGGLSNYQKVAKELIGTGVYVNDIQADMATIRANVKSGAITTEQAKKLVKQYVSPKR